MPIAQRAREERHFPSSPARSSTGARLPQPNLRVDVGAEVHSRLVNSFRNRLSANLLRSGSLSLIRC